MKLECPKCKKPFLLSEEDVASFFPQVWCLACGTKIPVPLDPVQHLRMLKKNDRDRRLTDPK